MPYSYDCKLWLEYHNKNSLWASFLQQKYGIWHTVYANIYDSVDWKRIYRVYEFCVLHVDHTPSDVFWLTAHHGQFTIMVAYED